MVSLPSDVAGSWCSPACLVLLPIGIILVVLPLIWMVFGWLQMRFLKAHLKGLEKKRAVDELHAIQSPSSMKYGLWQGTAHRLLQDQKEVIKSNSLQLGISLRFVLEELEPLYREKANQAEWRIYRDVPATRSGFMVRARSFFPVDYGVVAWDDLEVCRPPENPNFHQLAGLLAYGPHALGKGQFCPRDGREDCSLVDAFFQHSKSDKANWFLSWVWSYDLNTVVLALTEWWTKFSTKKGVRDNGIQHVQLWWDFFIFNQFRMLEEGHKEDLEDIFACFGRQLQGVGRMIICLDKINESQYTCRIWTLLEVYLAIQWDIKITLAVPASALYIDDACQQKISFQNILDFCRVSSEKAVASIQADADDIKEQFLKEVGAFHHVDKTIEQFLIREVLDVFGGYQYQEDSRHFGVSLDFVLSEFKCWYRHKAPKAEWRLYDNCEVTQSGFMVRARNFFDVERGVVAWDDLEVCRPPENPNFHQLAGLLAYGPHALGKGQFCPRDGREDCSLVDVLRKENKSDKANWFLSWVWSYSLDVVCNALARWWDSHAAVVASEACPSGSVYLWWCFFVNNQFRMLEDGVTLDTDSLLEVFAEPLQRAGKVLMCMDNFHNCTYTSRIWCIFEIFTAVRRNIPVTLIMPQLELEQEIETLTEMVHACRVDAWQATASVKADEDRIKSRILQELKSFDLVNEKVEQALWIEMIKLFKARKAKAYSIHSSSVFLDQQQIGCVVSL